MTEMPARSSKPKANRGLRRSSVYETRRFYASQIALLHRLISRTTKRAFDTTFGITLMEWRVLAYLEHRSPSKISEIFERSLLQKPLTSEALRKLVKNGYAVREDDPADARAPFFSITEEGLQLYRAILRVTRKRQRGLESLFSEQEQKILGTVFVRLIKFYMDQERQGGDGVFLEDSRPKRRN